MSEWVKVVTQPLGLIGFVLFLVFGYLGKVKRQDERRWFSPVALSFAAIALVGGLALAYMQTSKAPAPAVQTSAPPAPIQQTNQTNKVKQTICGAGSPNVQDVHGDVVITVDQSTGKTSTETKKPPEKKPNQARQ
jgi:hypothetical protein